MECDQRLVENLGDMYDDVESVGSDVGGTIPPMQGAGLPAEGMYLSTEEEIRRRTVHAWRGADMPMQSAVSRQDVEELAQEAASAIQATAVQSAMGIARLTQETGTTFGRVEAAMFNMDSRVESVDDQVQRLQADQREQQQRTQAALQSTAALEQQLHQAKERRRQEAAQHKAEIK